MMSRFRKTRGFSLIELMVVLAIMGVVMSLTGGLVFKAFEKNKRHVELQRIKQTFKVYSYKSFYTGANIKIKLRDNQAIITNMVDDSTKIMMFDSLNFVSDTFSISRKLTVVPNQFGIFINEIPVFYPVPSVLKNEK
ncbi:prepilin-type N-terminal cleavage/methylation domain-containing protein [Pseudoalteromonas citrea]